MTFRFEDRTHAGRLLAARLQEYTGRKDVAVLALPRGGVPVAHEVARMLDVPLDVLIVRKLGVPRHPELAMGAIASGGASYFNKNVIQYENVSRQEINRVFNGEALELKRREKLYRGNRSPLNLKGRVAIIVDDGIATGATVYAAVKALRTGHPSKIIVAVPVAPEAAKARILSVADDFVCILTPVMFNAVGQFYKDFNQVSDDEVRAMLYKPINEHRLQSA